MCSVIFLVISLRIYQNYARNYTDSFYVNPFAENFFSFPLFAVVSKVAFFKPKSDGSLQAEGRPFQLQCIFDASDYKEIDLSQRTVIWKRPPIPPDHLGVKIDDNSKYGNITLDQSMENS